jgi:hypothetical protein
MLYKYLGWEKDLAKFALHRLRMLEDPLIKFDLAKLILQVLISGFYLSNRVTKALVDLDYF